MGWWDICASQGLNNEQTLSVHRIGWQGLFYDRLEGHLADEPLALVPPLPHAPAGTPEREPLGLYLVRNRVYSPALGRFLQRDPNETAIPLVAALTTNASSFQVFLNRPDMRVNYADGMNLYAFGASNPILNTDPLGLSIGDDVDGLIGEIVGARTAGLATLGAYTGMMVNTAQLVGGAMFSLLPGADAAMLAIALAQGKQVSWADVLGAGIGLAGPFGKAAGSLASSLTKYAGKYGHRLAKNGDEFAGMIGKACNCFVAGTVIETPHGPRPIECLDIGDQVLSKDQHRSADDNCNATVTDVFKTLATEILWISLDDGNVLGTTPGHEVWTLEQGWVFAGEALPGNHFQLSNGSVVRIVDVRLAQTPTWVYNIEVDGTFTYYADGIWVHNRSCKLKVPAGWHRHHLFPREFRSKFDKIRPKLDIDSEDFLMPLAPDWHTWLHSSKGFNWNDKWRDFFLKFRNPSREQAIEFMQDLKSKAGPAFQLQFGR